MQLPHWIFGRKRSGRRKGKQTEGRRLQTSGYRHSSSLKSQASSLHLELLEDRLAPTQPPQLLFDVNQVPEAASITELTEVNGTIFFSADDGTYGRELWKTDGTAAGTERVKDIYIGNGSSWPKYLTNVNGTLFFQASDFITSGLELWKSDGTDAGTVLVKDILAGTAASNPNYLTNVNGALFFQANNGGEGRELWKSDGTEAGTVLVKDVWAGSSSGVPYFHTNVNGTLFFSANDGTSGRELWKSDGTAAGTVLLKDILAGSNSGNPNNLTNVSGTLYFQAYDGVNGAELWKSDGTAAGTVLVKDIQAGTAHGDPLFLTNVNGTLFFRANDGVTNVELWKSDGTAAGTQRVKDIVGPDNFGSYPTTLVNVNGALFFQANNGGEGRELWKSDGTEAGTVLVKDIRPGSNSALAGQSARFTRNATIGNTAYFLADNGVVGNELWKSDGTAAGTVLVSNIRPGSAGQSDAWSGVSWNAIAAGGQVYIVADDGTSGPALWKSDGTAAGTVLVKDIRTGTRTADPKYLTRVGNTLFFSADDGVNGRELWKTDGTAAGTSLVKDIFLGATGSIPGFLTDVNGILFFSATDAVNGRELWKTDGTAAGTVLVKSIVPLAGSSYPSLLTNVSGGLFFTADDAVNGWELWKSDGTAAGTVMVKDINPGSFASLPNYLTNFNGTLFFQASEGVNGQELWKSDGTTAGTVLVKDIRAGSNGGYPYSLTNLSGTLFFVANDGVVGWELWKTDGTEAGTQLVKDVFSGGSAQPRSLTDVNGTLFFRAGDGTSGGELWKSDGTATGTVLVRDIQSGYAGSNLNHITDVVGTAFFAASTSGIAAELWKSDGTAAGTVLVKDIDPNGESNPSSLTNVNGTLYFTAALPTVGLELWESDGTEAGTQLVRDIRPGTQSSSPANLTVVNGTLFFTADDGIHSFEVWILRGGYTVTVDAQGVLTINGLSDEPGDLSVSLDGGVYTFHENGDRLVFDVLGDESGNVTGIGTGTLTALDADITSIVLNLGARSDRVTFASSIAKPIALNGGDGDDLIVMADGGAATNMVFHGGDGDDTIDFSPFTTPVNVDLGAGTATGLGGLLSVETAKGGMAGDNLSGGPGNDRLVGGPGVDRLVGSGGADSFDGGPGFDSIFALDGQIDQIDVGADGAVVTRDDSDIVSGVETRHQLTTGGLADRRVTTNAADSLVNLWDAFADNDTLHTDPALAYSIAANSAPWLFSAVAIDLETGTLTLDYAPNATGIATITVQAEDPDGLSAEATITVFISRILATSGTTGENPNSLLGLAIGPSAQTPLGNAEAIRGLEYDANGILYAAGDGLSILDPMTGAVVEIGMIHNAANNVIALDSVAFSANGVLYGLSNADRKLYTIDPRTGLATLAAPLLVAISGIDFAPNGTLYGAGSSLYTLDVQTGDETLIAFLPEAMADIDLAADGFLYAAGRQADLANQYRLYRINPANGAATVVGAYDAALLGLAIDLRDRLPGDFAESNDTLAGAYDLQIVSGTQTWLDLSVHDSSDIDWFRFDIAGPGAPGHYVAIDFSHASGDLDLALFEENGQFVAASATVGNREQIALAGLPAAEYLVRVAGFNDAANPKYVLSIGAPEPLAADFAEPNDVNTAVGARNLGLVSSARRWAGLSIDQTSDDDWFRFETIDDGQFNHRVSITFNHSLGGLDLELFDSSGSGGSAGSRLRVSAGTSATEEVSLAGLPAGTYFVRVFGTGGATNPDYALSIRAPKAIAPDFAEPSDSRDQAFTVDTSRGLASLAGLNVHLPGNDDWYSFVLDRAASAGDYARIEFAHAFGDLDLELFGANPNAPRLAASEGAGDVEEIDLAQFATAAGIYYLRVVGYNQDTNADYALSVRVAPPALEADRFEVNNGTANATALDISKGPVALADLSIDSAADVDYYRFTTTSAGKAGDVVRINFRHAEGDLTLELLDQNGALLAASATNRDSESILLSAKPAGTYYLRVSGEGGSANGYDLQVDAPGSVADWTVLVYMTAGNRENYAFLDINEMEAAAQRLPAAVNLAVFYDQSAQSDRQRYATGGGSQAPWGTAGRAFIQPDNDRSTIATSFELLGEQNTGDAATLVAFVNWAKLNAPADHYALVLWDHGSGVFGANQDYFDTANPDQLTIPELVSGLSTLSGGGITFDLVAFDASLMAMAEVVHALAPFADVVVGSEDVGQNDGFDYSTAFASLAGNAASVTPQALAAGIVQSHQKRYERDTSGPKTLSTVDASAVPALAAAIDAFTSTVLLPGNKTVAVYDLLRGALEGVSRFGDVAAFNAFRDLGQFFGNIAAEADLDNAESPGSMLRDKAQDVVDALASAVVARAHDPSQTSGLAIFLPNPGPNAAIDTTYLGAYTEFFADSGWNQFLQEFVTGSSGRAGEIPPDWAESNDVASLARNLFSVAGATSFPGMSLHRGGSLPDRDWYRFALVGTAQAGHTVTITNRTSGTNYSFSVAIYDRSGTTVVKTEQTGVNEVTVSLAGLTANTYSLLVKGTGQTPASLKDYHIAFSAPAFLAGTGADWASGNDTSEKAEALGQITRRLVLTGLTFEPSVGHDWFRFSTTFGDGDAQKLRLHSSAAALFSIALVDPDTDSVIRSATGTPGATFLEIEYESGDGQEYLVHVFGSSQSVVTFQLEFRPLPSIAVNMDVIGRVAQTGQWWVGKSTSAAFTNQLFGTWSPSVTWVDVQVADVNDDGLSDVLGRWQQTGQWWVGRSNGTAFSTTLFGVFSTTATWVDVRTGDVTGDGLDDVIGRWSQMGQWWLGRSTGTSFVNQLLGVFSTTPTWVDVQLGDVDADGDADIIARWSQTGQWWVGRSNGTTITNVFFGIWSPGETWVDVRVADINADGRADVVGRSQQTGQWWAAISNGNTFANQLLGTWSPAVTWVNVAVGDVNGDSRADIVGRVAQSGQWWVGLSNGTTITTSSWGNWSPAVTWVDVKLADVNADDRADLVGRWSQAGQWWVGESDGTKFTNRFFGSWSSAVTWTDVSVGNFDGSGESVASSGQFAVGGLQAAVDSKSTEVGAGSAAVAGGQRAVGSEESVAPDESAVSPSSSFLDDSNGDSLGSAEPLSPAAIDLVFASERTRARYADDPLEADDEVLF